MLLGQVEPDMKNALLASSNKNRLRQLLDAMPPVIWIILLLMVTFTFLSRNYLSVSNLTNIAQQGAVLLLVAAAQTFVILSGGLDLSLGSVLTLSGITTALALNAGIPIPLAIIIGLITGASCGAITGLLIAYANIQPFIASLGIQGIFYGFALALTKTTAIFITNRDFAVLGSKINGIPMAAIISGILYLILIKVSTDTQFGRFVIAIGGNESGTRLSGIDTTKYKWLVYVFAGFVTALGGVLLASRLEVADPIVGVGWEFDAIAATILGGTTFTMGKGSVSKTVIGVLLISVIRNGLNVIGVPSIWQPALTGTLLIASIVFQIWFSLRKEARE
jgi:ribose transport system permease protein